MEHDLAPASPKKARLYAICAVIKRLGYSTFGTLSNYVLVLVGECPLYKPNLLKPQLLAAI